MDIHSKKYDNTDTFRNSNRAFTEYQRRHNIIRKDYEVLLKITEENVDDSTRFDALYRASLKSFLSLIESDIFGLNQIDSYDGYSDRHSFEDRFKKTFKQICSTWNKNEIISQYLSTEYVSLKNIKKKRDKLIHPKNIDDIFKASEEDFKELKRVFENYNKMLHSIMNNFFIKIEITDLADLSKLL